MVTLKKSVVLQKYQFGDKEFMRIFSIKRAVNNCYRNIALAFAILLAVFITPSLHSQPECLITADLPLPVCHGSLVQLSVEEVEGYTYFWEPDGQTTSSIDVVAFGNATFSVRVVDTLNEEECLSAPFTLEVRPLFDVSLEQMQLTCTNGDNDNGNTAMIQAKATGDSDVFHYFWDISPIQIAPGDSSLAIGLKSHLWYFIETRDEFGCSRTDSIFTEAYPNPEVEIQASPDTAYIQNPFIEFSFENLTLDSIDITNHFWNFGDDSETSDLLTPRHLYREEGTYNVFLTVYNLQGCDTTFTKEVKVLPVKLQIPNILTPNGDGTNDVFEIVEAPPGEEDDGIGLKQLFEDGRKPLSLFYRSTNLMIFNRQGRIVYESDDYQNDWDGGGLSDGVYFYVLQCVGWKSNEVYKGSLTIISGRNN